MSGEIINADSMQTIRKMDIGTAKPSKEEKAAVPHHLFDLIEPDEYFSAGSYMEAARKVCRDVARRGRLPIVVGGTGLYIKSFLEGMFEGPGRSEELRIRLRRVAERKGALYLHRWLEKKDPHAASRIQPLDLVRVIRGLEVVLLTGEPISALQREREPLRGFQICRVGLNIPREILYDRINQRVLRMFEQGLTEEVEQLLQLGYSADAKGFEALGYRYAVDVVKGELGLDEAIELTQRDTRRYAKRQLTWFRKEEGIHWITSPGEEPAALDELLAHFRLGESIDAV